MSLFTDEQRLRLIENGQPENVGKDHVPVMKLYLPNSPLTLLLTELNPGDPNWAYGLCDLGIGEPQLGTVFFAGLEDPVGCESYFLEPDEFFTGHYPLSVYVNAATEHGKIIEDEAILAKYARHNRKKTGPQPN